MNAQTYKIAVAGTGYVELSITTLLALQHQGTCQPALEYLKRFFREIVNGRRDYENLLPMMIGLTTNHV